MDYNHDNVIWNHPLIVMVGGVGVGVNERTREANKARKASSIIMQGVQGPFSGINIGVRKGYY